MLGQSRGFLDVRDFAMILGLYLPDIAQLGFCLHRLTLLRW